MHSSQEISVPELAERLGRSIPYAQVLIRKAYSLSQDRARLGDDCGCSGEVPGCALS